MEQRAGRIVRQGNQNKEVHIYRYVTEGTFDAYLWQTVENKQRFISQIMTSKNPVRSCDDMDEAALSYAEIKALCAGDPRIKQKMDLDVDVARLRLMKSEHQSKQYRLEDRILRMFPREIQRLKAVIAGYEKDIAMRDACPLPEEGFVGMELRGTVYSDKEKAGEALIAACKEAVSGKIMKLGSYRGFEMRLEYELLRKAIQLTLQGEMMHQVDLGIDARGNLVRIENMLSGMEDRLNRAHESLENYQKQMEAAKAEAGKPFPQEEELREKSAQLAALDALLSIDAENRLEQELEEDDADDKLEQEMEEALRLERQWEEEKKERPSVLESLRNAPKRTPNPRQVNRNHEVR